MQRGRASGVGATPWVPGGGAWHRGWAEAIGRRARDWEHLGGVRACGCVADRAAWCLPAVRSRACVDAWTGAVSCGSFQTVPQVAIWVLGLLLYADLEDYGNAPDNAFSG
jgi:hypothetical protein